MLGGNQEKPSCKLILKSNIIDLCQAYIDGGIQIDVPRENPPCRFELTIFLIGNVRHNIRKTMNEKIILSKRATLVPSKRITKNSFREEFCYFIKNTDKLNQSVKFYSIKMIAEVVLCLF